MSSPAGKPAPPGTAATSWWVPPRLLSAALLLALLLVCTLDSSAVLRVSPPRTTRHPSYYLGPLSAAPPPTRIPRWLSAPSFPNFTATLLSRWLTPGGEPCRDSRTVAISIPSLDAVSAAGPVQLTCGEVHEFALLALDSDGRRRCLGGDYFETDLSGASWKSRPTVADSGDGSYLLKLQVHPRFAGNYNLIVVLLFRSFEGLKLSPERHRVRELLRRIPITFVPAKISPPPPELPLCRPADFTRDAWAGRWTRHARNDSCTVDDDGRYRCLPADFPCEAPWCEGPLGALESNGWAYSAHCHFRLFSRDAAWECLRGRWLFFWGDSNHVDTIRNLLAFVLGLPDAASQVRRRFDARFANPSNASESVRITNVFNGHWNETLNYLGLQSLQSEQFRRLLSRYFSNESAPDTLIFNSGLHDGVYWRSIRAFAEGAEYAAIFWEEVLKNSAAAAGTRVFYRTTVAAGGYARDLAFNPAKMEAFNGVVVEKLRRRGLLKGGGVIDAFDMTFAWHYDNRCSDGVHYGRAPAKARWRDGEVGHHYFVDLMLGHVLLNAICNA